MSSVAVVSNSQAYQYLQANPVSNVKNNAAAVPVHPSNTAESHKVNPSDNSAHTNLGSHVDTFA
jgi:hypothetical protein